MRNRRSVVDFESEDALREALMAAKLPADEAVHLLGTSKVTRPGSDEGHNQPGGLEDDVNQDWVLPTFDPITTEAQSMKEELHRLQALKSYLILDAEKEECFDRLTRISARFFKVPICVMNLVDLGRHWVLSSNVELGDNREISRKDGFCSHTILSKSNIMIVPDATKDFRFKENPFVTGPPEIRFYAAAPLISPEGYKLGTFCIDDFQPRPDGLSEEDKESLLDFAALAVRELVKRKNKLLHPKRDPDENEMIAYAAHDLMTPLTGVHLSLSLLQSDEETKHRLRARHSKLISSASLCSDVMVRMCQTAIDTLRGSPKTFTPSFVSSSQGSNPVVKTSEIVDLLVTVMDPVPKKVPLAITLDRDVPSTVVSDDLKLFRSALNLITNAIERTSIGFVHLRILVKSGQKASLCFECSDTGPEVKAEEYQDLFVSGKTAEGNLKLDLSCVATMISSLDGEYGFCPMSGDWRTAVFWFSVPLYTPENFGIHASDQLPTAVIRKFAMSTVNGENETIKQPIIPHVPPKVTSKTIYGHFPTGKNVKSFHESTAENVTDHKRDMGGGAVKCDLQDIHSEVPTAPLSVSIRKFTGDVHPTESQLFQRKRHALIIEDSMVVRKSLARALERQGLVTAQAVNGLEGLKSMKSIVYDFVLCDLLMPVMDGLDCVKQYREWEKQHRPELQQYVVGISAHGGVNDGNKGINAGMNDFKPKPISMKTLTEIRESNEVKNLSRKLDDIKLSCGELEAGASSVVSVPATEQSHLQISLNQSGLKRLGSIGSLNDSNNEGNHCNLVGKKQKVNHEQILSAHSVSPACLVATDTSTQRTKEFGVELENHGWKCVVVSSGEEAFELLMKRTWNAVLVDDNFLATGGTGFVEDFRSLEKKNRTFLQPNVLMACTVPMPSVCNENSVFLPPTGFDGFLGNPLTWKQFSHFLSKSKEH